MTHSLWVTAPADVSLSVWRRCLTCPPMMSPLSEASTSALGGIAQLLVDRSLFLV